MKRDFGRIVATVKDLKSSVDYLKKIFEENQQNEIKEIVETQRVMDEVVVAYSYAIQKINNEIGKRKSFQKVKANGLENTKHSKNSFTRELLEAQEGLGKSVAKNADNIKVLDNEINCILEEKKNKEINRK